MRKISNMLQVCRMATIDLNKQLDREKKEIAIGLVIYSPKAKKFFYTGGYGGVDYLKEINKKLVKEGNFLYKRITTIRPVTTKKLMWDVFKEEK